MPVAAGAATEIGLAARPGPIPPHIEPAAQHRAIGVHPFCLTTDPDELEWYMADVFGQSGYLVVQRSDQLPKALPSAVQRLIT